MELTASNVVYLRCAAEHLEMTEEIAEGNLITQTEVFLDQVVLRSWKDSIKALQTCEYVLPDAEDLQIVKRCIDSLAIKACKDPSLVGWPIVEHGPMQSPGGSILWNGISTGARPRYSSTNWWYEDVSSLSLPMYRRLISSLETRGIGQEIISGSLTFYASRHLPGLDRRQSISEANIRLEPRVLMALPSEEEQRHLLEEIDRLLPSQKGLMSTKILFGLLRTAMILRASPSCMFNLERRIGMQLDQASLGDLLIPNFSDSTETLYNVDCIHRIVEHFLARYQMIGGASPDVADDDQFLGSPSLIPVIAVAKLVDGYLAEVASDANLKPSKFQALAAAIPDDVRPLDDGLYRAIDIYLKFQREELCRLMNCQKLSLEACTHAAQNERLPLRVVVQVLFFEQLQLKTSIAGCFLVSDNLDGSRPLRSGLPISGEDTGWASAIRENQVLKVGMDSMRMRVSELEKECSSMREELEKLTKGRSGWSAGGRKFRSNIIKGQICSAQEDAISKERGTEQRFEKEQLKLTKYKNHM
ncbi:hypothetical protein BHM03_00055966 [Ensete ventricosum]|nr:hypothetical protein BHM03_00055966 [Ensete ventricosum]